MNRIACLSAVLVLGIAGAAGYVAYRATAPRPPEIDIAAIETLDPPLARKIAAARTAVAQAPRSGDAWGRLGMVLLAHRMEADARTCFRQAAQLDPSVGRWPYLAAQVDLKDDPARAVAELERAVALQGEDATMRLLLAETLLGQDRLEDAERHFRAALEDDPDNPRAHLGLARLALRRDNVPQALAHLRTARQQAPATKAPRVLLAEILQRQGEFQAAERERQALAALPDQRWPDAHLEAVERLSVEAIPRLDLARYWIAQGRTRDGIALLEQTVQDHPKLVPAWISLGEAWLVLEQWPAAEAATRQALALQPDDAVGLNDLGLALSRQGRHAQAVACYRQALRLNPQNSDLHYQLGCSLVELGQTEEAIAAFRAAVRRRPQLAPAWRELGQLLTRTGDPEGLTCLRRAAELAPEDPVARQLIEAASVRRPPPAK